MLDWTHLPQPKPDFANLLAVLRRDAPARPTLFEFFLNDRLYERLAPSASLPAGPYRLERQELQAYYRAGYDYVTVRVPNFDFPTGRDFSARTISLSGGGMIVDWPSYETYPWPDVEAADYAILDALAADLPDGMKLIPSGPGGVLENIVEIVGFEKLCLLLADEPDLVERVFEAVGESLVRYYEIIAAHPAVGACIDNDDWGFKTQTLLSPRQMRRYVFPWHKRIVEACHRAGKPVILHSCGHFEQHPQRYGRYRHRRPPLVRGHDFAGRGGLRALPGSFRHSRRPGRRLRLPLESRGCVWPRPGDAGTHRRSGRLCPRHGQLRAGLLAR